MRNIIYTILLITLLPFAAKAVTPLPVEKAFAFSVYKADNDELVLKWDIAPGYYLYRNQLKFNSTSQNTVPLDHVVLPAGIPRHDTLHGNYQAYTGSLKVPLALPKKNKGTLDLAINYQGCSSAGFCYTPVRKVLKVNLAQVSARQNLTQYVQDAIEENTTSKTSENDFIEKYFDGHHLLIVIFGFLGLGLLLAFTPCVLPMVPILSAIILGQNKQSDKKKSFALSLAYVSGMAITYAVAGMLVALLGSSIQTELQKPWIIILFSGIFFLLGLSLLGLFRLQLPARWSSTITRLSNQQKGGSYIGVFLMGCLSTLIVSPCVTAPLVGVLTYIGQTGDVVLGGVALLSLGIGMGIPLLLIGISADKFLPKVGAWMNALEKIFGVIMIALAVWMLARSGIIAPQKNNSTGFTVVHSMRELDQALVAAHQHEQPALLDFYADWCVSCVVMDKTVFSRKDVQDALAHYVLLRADVTQNNAFDRQIMQRFRVIAPPMIVFFDKQGREMAGERIVGEMSAKEFLQRIKGQNQ